MHSILNVSIRVVCVVLIGMLSLCGKSNPTSFTPKEQPVVPTEVQLRFQNKMAQTHFINGLLQYEIRNIKALGVTWNESISYNFFSTAKTVKWHQGDFTLTVERKTSSDTQWQTVSITRQMSLVSGTSVTIELTFE